MSYFTFDIFSKLCPRLKNHHPFSFLTSAQDNPVVQAHINVGKLVVGHVYGGYDVCVVIEGQTYL